MDLRVLREWALDQRRVRARRNEEASGRVQALRRDGGPRRAWLVQVRATEVEAGRDDPRLVLRDQGRVLSPSWSPTGAMLGSEMSLRLVALRVDANDPLGL